VKFFVGSVEYPREPRSSLSLATLTLLSMGFSGARREHATADANASISGQIRIELMASTARGRALSPPWLSPSLDEGP
jgi:hypothetical protein